MPPILFLFIYRRQNLTFLSSLNNNITVSSYVIKENAIIYAIGKICVITFNTTITLQKGWNELGILPDDYSPVINCENIILNGSRLPLGSLSVTVNNRIRIYSNSDYSGYCVGEIIYPTK